MAAIVYVLDAIVQNRTDYGAGSIAGPALRGAVAQILPRCRCPHRAFGGYTLK